MRFVGMLRLCAALVAVVGLVGLGLAQEKQPAQPAPKDIVDVAKAQANLKTFCKLIEKAGLVETLKGKGPYTVFAPTDEAFDKLGKVKLDDLQKPEKKAELEKLLKKHVISGKSMAKDVEKMKTAKSLAGDELKITAEAGVIHVEKAKVTKGDVDASNGVIHIVDAVL